MPDDDGREPELDGLARMVGNGARDPSSVKGTLKKTMFTCYMQRFMYDVYFIHITADHGIINVKCKQINVLR